MEKRRLLLADDDGAFREFMMEALEEISRVIDIPLEIERSHRRYGSHGVLRSGIEGQ